MAKTDTKAAMLPEPPLPTLTATNLVKGKTYSIPIGRQEKERGIPEFPDEIHFSVE